MSEQKKTLSERLAEAKARKARKAHQDAIVDRKYVSEANKKIRKSKKTKNG
jgi:hypothetical protein